MAVLARRKANGLPTWLIRGAIGLGCAALVAIALTFVWPRDDSEQTHFDLANVDDYAVGSITTVSEGEFHLVRVSEDEVIALSWTDPHGGCTVPWRSTFEFEGRAGWFRNPCSGSTYDREGSRVSGSSPWDLHRYPVESVNGKLSVDTSRYVCGFAPPGAACVPP